MLFPLFALYKLYDAVNLFRYLGRGARHPADYHLLGINWRGNTSYVDCASPFDLCAAPKIFNAIAVLIAWVLTCQGVKCQLHSLDNFLLLVLSTQQGREF